MLCTVRRGPPNVKRFCFLRIRIMNTPILQVLYSPLTRRRLVLSTRRQLTSRMAHIIKYLNHISCFAGHTAITTHHTHTGSTHHTPHVLSSRMLSINPYSQHYVRNQAGCDDVVLGVCLNVYFTSTCGSVLIVLCRDRSRSSLADPPIAAHRTRKTRKRGRAYLSSRPAAHVCIRHLLGLRGPRGK